MKRMRMPVTFAIGFMAVVGLSHPSAGVTVNVPGSSNPYLAGMPTGTISGTDVVPTHSPALVADLCLRPGSILNFSATGGVSNDPIIPLVGPEGHLTSTTSHAGGAENGISDLSAPYNSLVGVFLDAAAPNLSPAPAGLPPFTTPASRDFLSLSPALKQLFFIGNGKTSANVIQQFVVPAGATRLFLATADCCNWANNPGSFTVDVFDPCPTPVEPNSWSLVKALYR